MQSSFYKTKNILHYYRIYTNSQEMKIMFFVTLGLSQRKNVVSRNILDRTPYYLDPSAFS